ncbi:MAG: PIN domain-containing protein [Deltaproteobacteria bacterium]|nr:PIN domain-containing protein [Deltaproteobacteria bacterium]
MSVDRIFLDANILFSVAYGSPSLAQFWALAEKGLCVLIASRYVIDEAKRNLYEPDQLSNLETCLPNLEIVLEADPTIACPVDLPSKDKPVLMAAISAKADYLITGDMTHFGKYFGKKISGVKICRARDYLQSTL